MLSINLSNSAAGLLKQLAQSQPKALSSALNKTAAKTKTAASTAVRERYNISKADYDKHMEIFKASPATLAAVLRVYGDRLSLAKFKVRWKDVSRRAVLCGLAVLTLGLVPDTAIAATGVKVLANGKVEVTLSRNPALKNVGGVVEFTDGAGQPSVLRNHR